MENTTPTPDAKDVADNKVMAILAYIGILFLVPLLAAKESPFAQFHANQGLLNFILMFASGFIFIIPFIGWIIGLVLYIISFVFMIMGIINAANGKMKELPVIGKYRLLK